MSIRRDRNFIGPQLRELRRARRWPQRLLAQKLCDLGFKATRSWVSKVEIREMIVNDFHLMFLASVLDVDLPELFQPHSGHADAWAKNPARLVRNRK